MKFQDIKIVLSGLDNAGKSSMLLGLKELYGYEDLVNQIKPTIRIYYYQRYFLNLNLHFFDMGGQEKFREQYLCRPVYFDYTNILIYLIDIQDKGRFSESLNYLGDVLDILLKMEYDQRYPIFICFSKSDFSFVKENFSEYNERISFLKGEIERRFSDFHFQYYSTSIFNVYSIVRLISDGIGQFLSLRSELEALLKEYVNRTAIERITLFDHTGIIMGDFVRGVSKKDDLDILVENERLDRIVSSHLAFFKRLEEEEINTSSSHNINGPFMDCCYKFRVFDGDDEGVISSFLSGLKSENNRHDSSLSNDDELEKILRDLIFSNYYLSLIVPFSKGVAAEKEVPDIINDVKRKLRSLFGV